MIKPFLQNEQVCRLKSIIDEANKNFLKESRISNNINFNILRVLSAFRLMYPQSPQSLYNAIIYITKNYNPTSFNQWKAAIDELSKMKRSVQKQKNNFSRPQIPSYMKTYQNSFNKQRMQDCHFQSKSFAQIKIPADLSLSDEGSSFCDNENKDISLTNADTGKRQYYTKTDTTQFPEKNHYISFQPYHHISGIYPHSYIQKENVNSTNIGQSRNKNTSYQYIEAIRRDLAKTNKNSYVKSPIDQSFIKNIDSYESPYLLSQADFLPLDPEDQKMNERAYGFLRFNLLFKSFSSMLANTLVLQKAKQHKLKAETQNRSNILQKIFQALKDNVEKQKTERSKQRVATMHFQKNMKNKVISVFKLIFDLRNKQNPLDIQRLNTFSYEFVLALLLSTQKLGQNAKFDWINFNLKIEQLISINQIDKVCLIVKYFGNHSWISQQNFQNLIANYRLSICKLVFKSIKSQSQQNGKFDVFRSYKLSKKAYDVLKSRWLKIKSYNIKVIQAKGRRNQTLQQKVMKALLQMVYSRKIYSKRCEYLQKKTEMGVRMKVMGQWLQKAKQKSQKKQMLKENIKISQLSLNRFYKRYALRTIQQDDIKLLDKVNKLQAVILASNLKKMFRSLRNSFENIRLNDLLQKNTKKMWYKLALLKWKSKTRKGKGIAIVFAVLKKYCFRSLMSPKFKQCIEQMNQIKTKQMNSNKLLFRQWKNWCNDQLNKYHILSQDFCSKMNFIRKIRIIKLLQDNYRYEQQLRKKQHIRSKSQNLMRFLESRSKKQSLFNLTSKNRTDKNIKRHTQKLNRMIYQHIKSRLFIKISEERQNNLKIKKLNKVTQNKHKYRIMNVINIQLLNFKKKNVLGIRKLKALKKVGDMAIAYHNQNSKKEKKADQHMNKKCLTKAIISLYHLIKQRDQVQALAQQAKENQYVQILSDGISALRRKNKVKKINNRLDKKLLLDILKDNRQNFNKYRMLCLRNREQTCKQVFFKLKHQNSSQNICKQLQQKSQILLKWIFISKIQTYYSQSLISKKYLFMAVKYRALKICLTAFNIWKKRRYPQKPLVRQNERVEKGKERLSTDVMD